MKKVLSILFVLIGLVWLNSCSSNREIVKKDGQGNILINQNFLSSIEGSSLDKPYYYSTDSSWLADMRLNDQVWELEPNSSDYATALEMEDSSFFIFQADIDETDKIVEVPWLAGITKEPQLRLLGKDDYPVFRTKEAIAGLGAYNPVKFIIRAVKMGPWHDKYLNIEDRYARDSRYVISWDKDAFPNVKYVQQANKLSGEATLKLTVKDGETIEFKETKSKSKESRKKLIEAGNNEAIIDIREGEYVQLCDDQGKGIKINPLKKDDLELEGLTAVNFALLNEDWLKITVPPDPVAEIIKTEPDKPEVVDDDWESFDQSRLGPMRYAKMKNYVESGYIRVKTEDLVKDDGQFISRSHKELALWCIDNKVIGINPRTGRQMSSFLIEPSILKEAAPDLYQRYKGNIHFPKLK